MLGKKQGRICCFNLKMYIVDYSFKTVSIFRQKQILQLLQYSNQMISGLNGRSTGVRTSWIFSIFLGSFKKQKL